MNIDVLVVECFDVKRPTPMFYRTFSLCRLVETFAGAIYIGCVVDRVCVELQKRDLEDPIENKANCIVCVFG